MCRETLENIMIISIEYDLIPIEFDILTKFANSSEELKKLLL